LRRLGYALSTLCSESAAAQGDVRECLFAAKRRDLLSGELAHAGRVRFILPPASSASVASFALLASIDADRLARAKDIAYADKRGPLRESLSADDTVAILVSFPDPAIFALVRELGGHLVPVIDRGILRQQVGDRSIYFAQEVEIEGAEWVTPAKTLIIACTPLVVFTGTPDGADAAGRRDHEDLIRTMSALDRRLLLPKASLIGVSLKRGKKLSATAPRRCWRWASRRAKQSQEATDQARQAAGRAAEAAKSLRS
jgi:hypothetical protein